MEPGPRRSGQRHGQATIHGAPASASGTPLSPAKSRRRLTDGDEGHREVDIPLVGGKIENFIGKALVDLLIAEQRFTTVWITENA